ncbi:hypothetical protein HaLaN_28976 [Haematococcus lacustris]|uniref:Uncharacterized protein n=1 Tax=Haematococcus lacustris TaxID=44745 RepID=A0A6A0AE91_HAELA|nr:hypothetical protein HaLaN_28976 [Haematococcus lacustris]
MTGCPRPGSGCTGLQSTGGVLMAGPATMHRACGQGGLAPGKSAIGVGFVVIKGANEQTYHNSHTLTIRSLDPVFGCLPNQRITNKAYQYGGRYPYSVRGRYCLALHVQWQHLPQQQYHFVLGGGVGRWLRCGGTQWRGQSRLLPKVLLKEVKGSQALEGDPGGC